MRRFLTLCVSVLALVSLNAFTAFAQGKASKVAVVLIDASNDEPVGFATISLTPKGTDKAVKYSLTNDKGEGSLEVRNGTYTFKAEIMGYETHTQEIAVKGDLDLGKVKMKLDTKVLDAASVSAVGNSIIIKKDTIEINANAFKTTENDVLEDLLKKIPGLEVAEAGSITANGQTIKSIMIDGKKFFLDDPSLASKNLPAKMIDKVKVVNKKSEQAEFTGIDDGQEEMVLDLSVKPGMMNGTFGNVTGGVGHDIPSGKDVSGDFRYQGAAFAGKFTKKSQLSFIVNANNTNNRAFNDLSGGMMGNMRGMMGGGRGGNRSNNGITSSYMGGVNGSWNLFDDKMELTGNYLYNNTDKYVEESSYKKTQLEDYDLISMSDGTSSTLSQGHRFGMRLDHKFSENTSILFEPQVNFGNGSYTQKSSTSTYQDSQNHMLNYSNSDSHGDNKNISTSGFALLRQRLGIPGRTLTVMGRYSFSNNDLSGLNYSNTVSYLYNDDGSFSPSDSLINQTFQNNRKSYSLWGRATYTEPIGHNLYLEANYSYSWSKSTSDKETFEVATGLRNDVYSSDVVNISNSQTIGANILFQNDKARAQLGFSAIPTDTYNSTTSFNSETQRTETREYKPGIIWKWAPQGMVSYDFSESSNFRLFYRGSSNQPEVSKLMPIPDNTDPINISFGNPSLLPYFSHNLWSDYRYNNKKKFISLNVHLNGGFVQDPIVNCMWNINGTTYNMPFNGPTSGNMGFDSFFNAPLGKSNNFTISNMLRMNWSSNSSYVATGVNMNTYHNDGYYAFMDEFVENFNDPTFFAEHIKQNTTTSLSATERIRFTYRKDNLEVYGSARTRATKSWYSIKEGETTLTFNNQVRGSVNWTWDAPGIVLKTEANYNWYNGYATPQESEVVMDAEIQKLLFKKKVTLALKGYDIFGQAKNLSVANNGNVYSESRNNTLGRYIILSLTYRFGTFDRSQMRGHGGYGPPRR